MGKHLFMPEIPLPLQQPKSELCAGINERNFYRLLSKNSFNEVFLFLR